MFGGKEPTDLGNLWARDKFLSYLSHYKLKEFMTAADFMSTKQNALDNPGPRLGSFRT